MKLLRWFTFIGCVLLMAACDLKKTPSPEEECNFQQDAYLQRIHWYGATMPIYADPSLSADQVVSLQKAIDTWNGAFQDDLKRGGVFMFAGVLPNSVGAVNEGVNVVSITTEGWPAPVNGMTENAHTVVNAVGDGITDADVVLNGNKNLSSSDDVQANEIDTVALLTHELGHALGLKDINETADYTVMYGQLWAGVVDRREIGTLELDALRCEY